eukprot:TRINITY_DN2931_c0_g4_i1.p1 TRINITY_DN2931_c0_g4~~TRINITY_DN2931_c0_g4_i1.p1  ORF type:complete len:353 (-),score=39.13 TRINITY_DN2931_c0_g4_i1:27-1085(-)
MLKILFTRSRLQKKNTKMHKLFFCTQTVNKNIENQISDKQNETHLKEQHEKDVQPPVSLEDTPLEDQTDLYNKQLSFYRYQNNWRKAKVLFAQMGSKGILRDDKAYTLMIEIMRNKRRYIDAFQYFKEMKSVGFKPTQNAFASIIDIFSRESRIPKMLEFVEEMKQTGIPMTTSIYSSMIRGYAQVSEVDNMLSIFKQMKETEGLVLQPEPYNAIMHFYATTGDVDKMVQYFDEMAKDGVIPNDASWATLFLGFGHLRKIETAFDYYHRYIQSDATPTILFTSSFVSKILVPNDLIVEPRLEDFMYGRRRKPLTSNEYEKFKLWVSLSEEKMRKVLEKLRSEWNSLEASLKQ